MGGGGSHAGQVGLSLPELQACTTMQVGVRCAKDRIQGFVYARWALSPVSTSPAVQDFFLGRTQYDSFVDEKLHFYTPPYVVLYLFSNLKIYDKSFLT